MHLTDRMKRIARRTGVRTAAHAVRRALKRSYARAMSRQLRRRIRRGRGELVGTHPVVVSLTSYGDRVADVAIAIESIGRGSVRPSRLILWIDDGDILANLPLSLRQQQQRGLEILPTLDYGPHKKYFPYAVSMSEHQLPLVTADDDVIYPRHWLRNLTSAFEQVPDAITCYRANVVQLERDGVAPYSSWPRCRTARASCTHFATGVSGVMYPPAMLDELAQRGTAFEHTAPRADDVWLHWVALRTNRTVRQVSPQPQHFPFIPGSQTDALTHENVGQNGNDVQIAALYTLDDIAALRRAGA